MATKKDTSNAGGSSDAEFMLKATQEAFGCHPEDAISHIKCASDAMDWLREIFCCIDQSARRGSLADWQRVRSLAGIGNYIANDFSNYLDCAHEDMFEHLKAVGLIHADVVRLPELAGGAA